MYSLLDGVYDAFSELMHYFYFEFNIYCILTLIIFINCFKSIMVYLSIKKDKNSDGYTSMSDVIISILCGLALFNALLFQGVISDISNEHSKIWFSKVFFLCIASLIMFIIQLYFLRLQANYKN